MEISLQDLKSVLCQADHGAKASVPRSPIPSRREIVVADRGWVFTADVTEESNGDLTLRNGAVIRVWGTTKGLGQLALEGKQPNTKLDPIPVAVVPARSLVARFVVASGVVL